MHIYPSFYTYAYGSRLSAMNSLSNPHRSDQLTTVSNSEIKKRPRQARQILSEEDYTATLSSIITRDYFPAIPSLQRDMAILDRRREGDFAGAVQVRRAARKLALHEEECARREEAAEDLARRGPSKGIRETPRPLHRESVDGFHARVTSEDNEDFERQMRKDSKNLRERMQLIYNSCGVEAAKVGDKLRILNESDHDTHLKQIQGGQIDDDSFFYASDQFKAPRALVHVAGTSADGKHSTTFKNSLFFTPLHESWTSTQQQQYQAQISEPTEHGMALSASDSTRLLMLPPAHPLTRKTTQESFSSLEKRTTLDEDTILGPSQLVEYVAKPMHEKGKRIVPSQTRFPYQTDSRLAQGSFLPSSSHDPFEHRGDLSSDVDTSDYYTTDLDEPVGSIDFERRKRRHKLDRERRTFVAMTPLIIPGQGSIMGEDHSVQPLHGANASPIMTWGQVASTPLVLGGSSTKAMTDAINHQELKTFVFSKVDPSENMARLAEDALAKKAKRFKDAGTHISIQSSSTPFLARTPKGHHGHLKGVSSSYTGNVEATPRSRSAFGSALRESYSCSLSKHRDEKHHHHSNIPTKNISLKDTPVMKKR